MRQAVGVAVFFGMIGVTAFGLIFTPVFYVLIRRMSAQSRSRRLHKRFVIWRRRPHCRPIGGA